MARGGPRPNSGGYRPGAGRKPAGSLSAKVAGADDAVTDGHFTDNPPKTYSEMEDLARATLKHVMLKSPQDASRVAAAREVILRAEQERETAGVVGGKKEAQKAAIEDIAANSSRFAVKRPPGTMAQ